MPEPTEPSPRSGPAFLLGDLVAGRWRIRGFLGRGAMGEVFAAEDLELGGRVALKTLRARLGADANAVERFKREVLLARKVSHPGVCRIFEFGVHRPASDGAGAVLFLTMELLEGENLAHRLDRQGPLCETEARALGVQLAEALAAAHRAGVIHRDFKTANVMLVPSPEGKRAVITDFGLARGFAGDHHDGHTVTEIGGVLGTPAYMAPEQVEGKPLTAAADLFALGVVLFEMTTLELPWEGESPLSVAMKRVHEPPRSIAARRGDLSPGFRAIVERCLARRPEDRFADASEVAAALAGAAAPAAHAGLRQRRPRWAALAALGIVAVAVAAGIWRSRSAPAAPGANARRAIAVLGFANRTGREDLDWLSPALAEMLTTELAGGDALRAVPGELVERARADLGLGAPATLSPETLARVRKRLTTDFLLVGSYSASGSDDSRRLRLDLRLQRATSGDFEPLEVTGPASDLFQLVAEAGARLRDQLGIATLSAAEEREVRAALPSNAAAARLYGEGLDRLRRFDPLAARERLAAAVAADPSFPLAHAGLARAWSDLGYDARAREAAARASELAGSLPSSDRLRVRALAERLAGDWDAAIATLTELGRRFPDELDAQLELADVELAAARPAAASATVAALPARFSGEERDPRIDLLTARAEAELGRYEASAALAARAAERARAQGAQLLVAQARLREADAQRRLGRGERVASLLAEARDRFVAGGDRKSAGLVAMALARSARERGDLAAAAELLAGARRTLAELGYRRGEGQVEFQVAVLDYERGDLVAALAGYERALAIFREVSDRELTAAALANCASILSLRGDLETAFARQSEALAVFRAIGNPSRVATALLNLAPIARDRLDLAGALGAAEDALRLVVANGDRQTESQARETLAEVRYDRGEAEAAAAQAERARTLAAAAGQRVWEGTARLLAARLALDRGAAREAAAAAATLAGEFAAGGYGDESGLAQALLAEALAASGDAAGAARALAAAAQAGEATEVPGVAVEIALATARVAALRHDGAAAGSALVAAAARLAGRAVPRLDLELAAARLECAVRLGQPVDAAARALVIERARAAGAERLARRVERLSRS
ncbi:MAG: serine/threonine-protein kinase [Thermoanaerobaculia bacterium]